jgi:hypothetical protein
MGNEFKNMAKVIEKAVAKSTRQALNQAAAQAKTQMRKDIGKETGLKASVINSRLRVKKAKGNALSVSLNFATKIGVALAEFGPRAKGLMSRVGKRIGATVKIGGQGRGLVPGGFILNTNGKARVITRKTLSRKPTVQMRTNAFRETIEKHRKSGTDKLRSTFERLLPGLIKFNLTKK